MRALFTLAVASFASIAAAQATISAPPAECEARVGYDRDRVMSGYILPTAAGERTCIPFSTVAAYPPPGYKGDFYVDEFSDARMRAQWEACRQEKACFERVIKAIKARQPPNREYATKNARHIYLIGKIEEGPEIDLKSIRRPAFFGADPWKETIAEADSRTWIVEFTAPREPYERIHKNMTDPIKLRGWYLRGEGVGDGKGGKQRALLVMSGGGGTRTTAITDPNERLYRIDASGKTHYIPTPNEDSGASGQHFWRAKALAFNKTGFDVLMFDRRGVGISGGYSDTNTHQQGRDILAIVASLRTGEGLRAMSPAGETRKGQAAAESVRGGPSAQGLPTILFGNSRGTMATGWAMTKNFDKDCTLDLPEIKCGPPVGDRNIKGAILFAEFTSGQGYVMDRPSVEDEERGLGRDRPLFIGGNEVENNLIFFPSSAILAGMDKWPAAFFARGTYDYAASLQGTIDSYSRVKGLKELVVVRGPHPFESWPREERARTQERALAFAVALIQGKSRVEGGRPWTNMKELVATTSDVWEESTKPTLVAGPSHADPIAAARAEGAVVVYSVLSNRAAAPLVEDFRKLYPGIDVRYDGDMGSTELVERFLGEVAQGKPSADVVWSSAMDLQLRLVEEGHAMVYASPEAAALPAWAVYRDRAWGTTFEPVVFIYNKDRVSAADVPRDHAAFAQLLATQPQRFTGKVAAFDIEKSGVGYMFAARDRRHFAGLDDLLRGFGRVDYRPSAGTGTMMEKVASGEYLLGYNIMGAYALVRARREPALGVVMPADYTLVLSRVAFINRAAPHPNAARLWLDYLLSKRGQEVIGNRLELFAIRADVDAEFSAARLTRELGPAMRPIPLSAEIATDLEPARHRAIIDGWKSAVAAGQRAP